MNKIFKNTPIIKIIYVYKNKIKEVYASLEYFSFTGSIKDKVIYHILNKSLEDGTYSIGQPIIEASSGNTAISVAAFGKLYNSPVYIFIPNNVSIERKKLLKLYGAHVNTINGTKDVFKKCIKESDKLAKKINGFRPNQFSNYDNIYAHKKYTAKNLVKKIKNIDAFISGVGTGGTIMGCAEVLKKNNKTKIIEIIPKTNKKEHMIGGISDGIKPDILDESIIDESIDILDTDAINMAIKFSKDLGLGIGISSAANFLGCVQVNDKYNYKKVITVFPDDNKKYLSVLKENKKSNKCFISDNIELLSFEII